VGTLDGERAEGSGTGTGTTSAEMSKVWGGVELSAARSGRRTEGERGGARFGTGRTKSGRAVPPPGGVEPVSDDEEGGLYTCGGSSDNLEAMKKALCVRGADIRISCRFRSGCCCPGAGARGERGKSHSRAHERTASRLRTGRGTVTSTCTHRGPRGRRGGNPVRHVQRSRERTRMSFLPSVSRSFHRGRKSYPDRIEEAVGWQGSVEPSESAAASSFRLASVGENGAGGRSSGSAHPATRLYKIVLLPPEGASVKVGGQMSVTSLQRGESPKTGWGS
jgi:hypothetical protein